MTLVQKLRSAIESPENWDIPGLLADAADAIGDAESTRDEPEICKTCVSRFQTCGKRGCPQRIAIVESSKVEDSFDNFPDAFAYCRERNKPVALLVGGV